MTAEWAEVQSDTEVLRDASADLSRLLADSTPNDTNLAWVVRAIADLDDARQHLGDALSLLNGWASLMMEGDEVTLPDFLVARSWSKTRTDWDSQRLRRDVVNSARASIPPDVIDPETGEMTHSWEPIVDALDEAYWLAGSSARITWLKRHGLAAGDYCNESRWKPRIKITRRNDEHDDGTAAADTPH